MFRRFLVSIFVVILIAVGTVAAVYYFDRESATLNAEDGYGADPKLPPSRYASRAAESDLVAKAIVPDYALGPHTASLGLAFNTGDLFPPSTSLAPSSASMGHGTQSHGAAAR